MNIQFINPDRQLSSYIHKISVFCSTDEITYNQKLTPSPFTCLSYNHNYIPDFKVAGKIFSSKSKLQITGPKTTDDIYAIHNGKLNQILIKFTPSGFYNLFQQSPKTLVNTTTPLSGLLNNSDLSGLIKNLAKSDD